MNYDQPLDILPLWLLFVLTVGTILFSVEVGFRLGSYRRRHAETAQEGAVGAMVAATLGLLAFLLAFTFGLAASRFDTRRSLVLEEANAIGTTFLRTSFLPEPQRAEIRKLLREYVTVHLEIVAHPETLTQGVKRSEDLHALLWNQAAAVGEKNPGAVLVGLFISSLNEVIDLHAKRLMVGLRTRIPIVIWAVLYLVAFLSFGELGYAAGLAGSRSFWAELALIFAFAMVIFLIADLDRPSEGLMNVSQQALVDVRNAMSTTQPGIPGQ